jgi:hypothetical protein
LNFLETHMLKKIFIALAVLLICIAVGFSIAVSLQPGTFTVQRSIIIAAPAAVAFPLVNDLAAWDSWTPWKKLDPNPETTISNPSAGKGATFSWSGNDQIGEGRLTILESYPNALLLVEQEFVKPFAGKARMTFTFVPAAEGTNVTWKMTGTNNFIGKAMCMFMDMDATLGTAFAEGLANIKSTAEEKKETGSDDAP